VEVDKMKTIKKFLFALTLIITLCFVPYVNATSSGGYYSMVVKIGGKSESTSTIEVTDEVKSFFNGVVTYNKDKVSLNSVNAEAIAIVDPNLHMDGPIELELNGTNTTTQFEISDCQLKVTGNGSLKFIPATSDGNSYISISDVESQKSFVSRYIITSLPITYENGYVYINKSTTTTTTKVTTTKTTTIKNATTSVSTTVGTTTSTSNSNYTLEDGNITLSSVQSLNTNYTLKTSDIYSNLTSDELSNYNSKLDGKTLIGLYDISIMNGTDKVDINDGKYTIRIPISDTMKNYSEYSIVYIKDGEILETISANVIDNNYIEFETTHLSEYGIVGDNTTEESLESTTVTNNESSKNHTTNIISIICYIAIVVIIIVIAVIIIRKKIK
jgi:hypothetical protein